MLHFAPRGRAASELEVYSDASWETRYSTSGGLLLYCGCLVVWWSRRQKSVSASTAEAETFAAALASREGVYARDLLELDFRTPVSGPTPLHLDNRAALDLAADPVAFRKTKHILRHAYELRERVARRVYAPVFCPSAEQLADILTKGLRPLEHARLLARLLPESADAGPGS